MSLQVRLEALIAAIGPDIKALNTGKAPAPLTSRLTATATRSAATYATSGMEVQVAAGKSYRIQAGGQYRTALATTGIGLRIGGTSTATAIRYWTTIYGLTASTYTHQVGIAMNAAQVATTGVAVAATDYGWQLEGLVQVNAGGTLGVDFMSEVGSSVVTLQTACYLVLQEIP